MTTTETRDKAVAFLEELSEDYILIMNDEDNEPTASYYTDIVTMAQSAKMLLRIVKEMLSDATEEEVDAVKTVLGM